MTQIIPIYLISQAFYGSPLYLLGSVAQALLLHRSGGFNASAVIGIAIVSTVITIPVATLIWWRVFDFGFPLYFGPIDLPGLLASLLVYPVIGVLCRYVLAFRTTP